MTPTIDRGRIRLLYSETRWLMRLRWVAAMVMIVMGITNWLWLHLYSLTSEPIVVGAILLVVNAVYHVLVRLKRDAFRSFQPLLAFASIQLHVDLLCLTLLAIWTGGVNSPILPAYFFHMIFASLLQPRKRAYAVAITAIAGLTLGLWLSSQWPVTRLDILRGLTWVVAIFATVYLTDRVARRLYIREVVRTRQLERIRTLSETTRRQHTALIQSEKMAAMGQLAAGVAHEINNPLASMDGVLQLMQRKANTPTPEGITTVREQVQRILRIVRQLTSYAHPGAGHVEAASINDIARSALDMFALSRAADRVTIHARFSEGAGLALVNTQAMQQVLTNLLVNAIDATVSRDQPQITVATRRDGPYCFIEVSDNGSGIEPEHLTKIFEPFFTTKPVGKGTGLGLSICSRLIEEQNGSLSVQSNLNEGSTFVIRLPSAQ